MWLWAETSSSHCQNLNTCSCFPYRFVVRKYILNALESLYSLCELTAVPGKLHSPNMSKKTCPRSAVGQEQDRAQGVVWGGHLGMMNLINPAPIAAPSAGTHGEKWVIGAVLVMEFEPGKHYWGRRQMQAPTKWPEAGICDRRECKHLLLQASHTQPSIKHCKIKTLKSFERWSPFFYNVLLFN